MWSGRATKNSMYRLLPFSDEVGEDLDVQIHAFPGQGRFDEWAIKTRAFCGFTVDG